MATHTILLTHSETGDSVLPEEVKVGNGDTLHLIAVNADFEISPFFITGTYDQDKILVTPQSPKDINVRIAPNEADVMEINCLGTHIYGLDAAATPIPIPPEYLTPSKIIVVRAGLEENVIRNTLVSSLNRKQKLIDSFYEIKKLIPQNSDIN